MNVVERSASRLSPGRSRTIGVLANTYESDSGIWAGGHLHFVQVVKRWPDVDVVVFAPEIARGDLSAGLPSARFVALPALPGGTVRALDYLFRSIASLTRMRELRRCDALLATSHFLPDVLPALISGRPVAVVVHHTLTSHGNAARSRGLPAFAEFLSLALVKAFASAVIAGSELVSRELKSRGFHNRMAVTTNGVDHLTFAASLDLSAEHRSGAVLVGRLHPTKNVLDAIRAWRFVANRFPEQRLTIIGAEAVASYALRVRALITELELDDNIVLTGVVSEEEKIRALERAKVFVFPSGEEGWGIAIAEAMAAGLPCVTYDLPIFSELFPQGRLHAPLGDHEALATNIVALFDDESLRLRYAREAVALAEQFSWDRAAHAEERILDSIIVDR